MATTFLDDLRHKQLTAMCDGYMERVNLLLEDADTLLITHQVENLLDLLSLISELDFVLYQLKRYQFKEKLPESIVAAIEVGAIVNNLVEKEEELKKQNIYLELH